MLKMVKKVQDIRSSTGNGYQQRFLVLETTWVNPLYIVSIEEDVMMKGNLEKGLFVDQSLTEGTFTRIIFSNGNSVCVLGSPSLLQETLRNKQLLTEGTHVAG